ncbi:TetR family transcriptional regulator [Litchfieldia salsa]|uniref:TetR family transcriptional regulator n=1 Tax=Litchfieldia salsa TaxID=930152 RepID=UPI001EE3D2F1|nr:TetR family transcriptional regulator [Litchfieldia salsa]
MTEDYKEKRRVEILKKAEAVFIEKGFSHTTMTDIVNATGLSRGGLYHYFSNTDELYQAIIHEKDKSAEEYFNQLLDGFETAWEGLDTYLNEVEKALINSSTSFASVNLEYFIIGRHAEGRRDFISERYKQAIGHFTKLLGKGVEQGEFKPIQPVDAIANYLINIVDSMHIQLLVIDKEQSYISEQIEGVRIYLKRVLGKG